MNRKLILTGEAAKNHSALEKDPSKRGILKQVNKTLGLLETNLRHPSLQTHEFTSLKGRKGERVFEAYVQHRTPGAFPVFFHYGPDEIRGEKRTLVIAVVAITPHP